MKISSRSTYLASLGVICAFVVAVTSIVLEGGGLPGFDAATRNSARFSALVFAVALASRIGSSAVAWLHTFVAAHAVHYLTVGVEAVMNVNHRLHRIEAWDLLLIGGGVMLLVAVALGSAATAPIMRRLNAVAVAVTAATFMGGGALNVARYRGALIPLAAVSMGLAIHIFRRLPRRAGHGERSLQP